MSPDPLENADPFLLDHHAPFLGLDVGDARIGVACSDALGMIARPLDTVSRIPKKECLNRMEALFRETGSTAAAVGLPLLESGVEGEQAEKTRAFVRSLLRRMPGLRIAWWDERYSTGDARDLLAGKGESTVRGRNADGSPRRKRGGARGSAEDPARRSRRDEIAAALLLQEWLDERGARLREPRSLS